MSGELQVQLADLEGRVGDLERAIDALIEMTHQLVEDLTLFSGASVPAELAGV